MKKKILKSVTMDTEMTFYENGNVVCNPNSWEEVKAPVTTEGKTVEMRGKMVVQPDGTTIFRAYRDGTGSKYSLLFAVLNGVLKTTKSKKKVVVLTFREGLTDQQVANGIRKQAGEIADFVEHRRR